MPGPAVDLSGVPLVELLVQDVLVALHTLEQLPTISVCTAQDKITKPLSISRPFSFSKARGRVHYIPVHATKVLNVTKTEIPARSRLGDINGEIQSAYVPVLYRSINKV
jgi:hypothetical protein